MTEIVAILVGLVLGPPTALVLSTLSDGGRRSVRPTIRAAAVASSLGAWSLLVVGLFWESGDRSFDVVLLNGPGRGNLCAVSLLSLPLFAMASTLWLTGLAVAPARSFDVWPARRSAAAFVCVVVAFLTSSPQLLSVMLVFGSVIFLLEHHSTPQVRRVSGLYLMASSVAVLAGAFLFALNGFETEAAWVMLAGLLIRKGIAPLHSWMPDSFEHGHLIPALLYHGPQVGTYAVIVLVLPAATGGMLDSIGMLALATTIYAAILAVAEPDARRSFGYLFMSESALVLAGVGSGGTEGLAGSLAVWVAVALSMGGLGLTIAALELRRGRLSLTERHGGFEQMPLLAVSFLVFGLATVGFPGTLAFLGEELLVGATIERFPTLGYAAVAATALNGITVLRMYFSLFCGRAAQGRTLSVRFHELAVFAAIAVALIVGGIFPGAMLDSRIEAAEMTLGRSGVSISH